MRKGFTLIELMIVIAIIAIIAAIAIPNLLESRVTANESAAAASMKSGVFAAQVQFQGGAYQDADADNVGEYGTMEALSGQILCTGVAAGQLRLLTGPLARVAVGNLQSANGYKYLVGVSGPSSAGGAEQNMAAGTIEGAAMPVAVVAPVNANPSEQYWTMGCAPESWGDTGRRTFMMSSDGQVRSPPTAANIAVWWGAAPVNGTKTTLALIEAGIANAYTGAPAWAALMLSTTINQVTYPVYSK